MSSRSGILLTLGLSVLLILGACSPCFYTPNAQSVPLFRESREGMVNFSLQGGLYSTGVNLQAAFSVTDHVGLMLNYHHFGAAYTDESIFFRTDTEGHFRGNFGEAAAGYFLSFYEKWIFEVYGGMGIGAVINQRTGDYIYYDMPYHSVRVSYHRYFMQPAIGWSANEHFELAFSYRFGLLHYKNLTIRAGDDLDIYDITGIDHNPVFLFEPAFTLRAGGKNVKFQYQVTYSANFMQHREHFDPFGTSFAVFFRIHGKKD